MGRYRKKSGDSIITSVVVLSPLFSFGGYMNWKNRIIGLEYHKPSDLQQHSGQWRDHPKAQADAMQGVLEEVGIAGALLAYNSERNGGLVLIDGHLRSGLDGDNPWPVLMLDVTDEEADYLLLTHDPLGAMALTDAAQLDALLHSITTGDEAVTKMLAELAVDAGLDYGNGAEPEDDPGADVDRAAELQEKWGTALGQVWQIGKHRLVCGDCTDKAVVDAVMMGEKAAATVTDPPYGVGIDYGSYDDTPENLADLVSKFLPIALGISEVVGLTPGNGNQRFYPHSDWTIGWFFASGMNRVSWGFQNWQPMLVWGKDPYLARGMGARPDAFWISEKMEDVPHPVAKPIKTWEWFVERLCPIADGIVYDPFVGSGTTIVACERLNRQARACEISPAYCAVTLERLSGMNLTPELASG